MRWNELVKVTILYLSELKCHFKYSEGDFNKIIKDKNSNYYKITAILNDDSGIEKKRKFINIWQQVFDKLDEKTKEMSFFELASIYKSIASFCVSFDKDISDSAIKLFEKAYSIVTDRNAKYLRRKQKFSKYDYKKYTELSNEIIISKINFCIRTGSDCEDISDKLDVIKSYLDIKGDNKKLNLVSGYDMIEIAYYFQRIYQFLYNEVDSIEPTLIFIERIFEILTRKNILKYENRTITLDLSKENKQLLMYCYQKFFIYLLGDAILTLQYCSRNNSESGFNETILKIKKFLNTEDSATNIAYSCIAFADEKKYNIRMYLFIGEILFEDKNFLLATFFARIADVTFAATKEYDENINSSLIDSVAKYSWDNCRISRRIFKLLYKCKRKIQENKINNPAIPAMLKDNYYIENIKFLIEDDEREDIEKYDGENLIEKLISYLSEVSLSQFNKCDKALNKSLGEITEKIEESKILMMDYSRNNQPITRFLLLPYWVETEVNSKNSRTEKIEEVCKNTLDESNLLGTIINCFKEYYSTVYDIEKVYASKKNLLESISNNFKRSVEDFIEKEFDPIIFRAACKIINSQEFAKEIDQITGKSVANDSQSERTKRKFTDLALEGSINPPAKSRN